METSGKNQGDKSIKNTPHHPTPEKSRTYCTKAKKNKR